jgi:hypothetical protein
MVQAVLSPQQIQNSKVGYQFQLAQDRDVFWLKSEIFDPESRNRMYWIVVLRVRQGEVTCLGVFRHRQPFLDVERHDGTRRYTLWSELTIDNMPLLDFLEIKGRADLDYDVREGSGTILRPIEVSNGRLSFGRILIGTVAGLPADLSTRTRNQQRDSFALSDAYRYLLIRRDRGANTRHILVDFTGGRPETSTAAMEARQ